MKYYIGDDAYIVPRADVGIRPYDKVDFFGRIVIPKEIRRTLRIREGDPSTSNIDINRQVLFSDT